jgi:hypothetical protein
VGEAVVGGGAAGAADDTGLEQTVFDKGVDDLVEGGGFGAAEGDEETGAAEPAIGFGDAAEDAKDTFAEGDGG